MKKKTMIKLLEQKIQSLNFEILNLKLDIQNLEKEFNKFFNVEPTNVEIKMAYENVHNNWGKT